MTEYLADWRVRVIVTVAKSIALFALAAVFEIGGAWLVWQGVREHRDWSWVGLGVIALGAYGFVATLQPDAHFGRIIAVESRWLLEPHKLHLVASWSRGLRLTFSGMNLLGLAGCRVGVCRARS